MMTAFMLIVTFYSGQGGRAQAIPILMPTPYVSYEACREAGREAKTNYNGGAIVDWTCVPVEVKP